VEVPLPWYALACATTLLNAVVFGVLGRRERQVALQRWALGWLAWGLAVPALVALGGPGQQPLAAVFCGLTWVASTLLFLDGAHRLLERKLARAWLWLAGADALGAIALGVGPHGATGMVPLVLFQSVGLMAAGVVLLRSRRGPAATWLAGPALIALGLHVLDAPLLQRYPTLFPWGFVVAIALQLLTALGVLALHYELAREELAEAQRVLERTQRIEALGRIAGGVAHDFNNILTVIQGNVDLLRHTAQSPEELEESLTRIQETVARAARLTRQLLTFGKRSPLRPMPVNLRQIVQATLDLLRQVVPSNIEMTLSCDEDEIVSLLDQALLEQIVLNLVTNARDAIAGTGHIRVELVRVDAAEPRLLLRVSDDGSGMDEQHLKRIFEPFFTSKVEGRGTGLGLAAVQNAVNQLGGQISVDSRPGQGTRFEVSLPLRPASAVIGRSSTPPSASRLRVLVVDDDASVRQITARMLQMGGHEVEQAEDGAVALERVKQNDYDLVVSDVVMPNLNGVDLRRELAQLHPHVTVLLTAGDSTADDSAQPIHLLNKPYGPRELLDAVARARKGKLASRSP
jgi:signal transduction histidine kinase